MWHARSRYYNRHHRRKFLTTAAEHHARRQPPVKAITNQDDESYHTTKYYAQAFNQHCDVCRAALFGTFYTDGRGYRYCAHHAPFVKRCFSCHRIVCNAITGGGLHLADGRTVCALCLPSAIIHSTEAVQAFTEARNFLQALECDLGIRKIPLLLIDGRSMHTRLNQTEHELNTHRVVCGQTRTLIEKKDGRVIRGTVREIVILNYLSRLHFTSVAVHELCHAWLFFNNFWKLPLRVEEGLCVLMEYLYLKKISRQDENDTRYAEPERKEALFLMRLIEESEDSIYGVGFRAAREAIQSFGLRRTLTALREKQYWPGTTPLKDDLKAFFSYFFS